MVGDLGGDKKLSSWVSIRAKTALKNIAKHTGKSQKDVLERLIIQEDERISVKLSEA